MENNKIDLLLLSYMLETKDGNYVFNIKLYCSYTHMFGYFPICMSYFIINYVF